jgi:hypothetical protein
MTKLSDVVRYVKPLNKTGAYSAWTAKLGDVSSVQASKDAATEALFTDVKVALSGTYEPVVLFKPGFYACCYRTITSGWCYVIRPVGVAVNDGGWTSGFSSQAECVEYAQRHLNDYE